MNTLQRLSVVLTLFSLAFSSIAQTTNEFWPITSVEVHELGARVEHTATLVVSSESTIIVRGISSDINPQTIQVDLPKGFDLETVQYDVLHDDISKSSELKTLLDSIAILELQKKMFEAQLHTLNEESLFLKANRDIGSDSEVLLVDDLIEMADFLRERNKDLGLEILDVQIDQDAVNKDLEKLYYRYNTLLSLGSDSEGIIELTFSSKIDNTLPKEVKLSYLIKTGFWVPEYKLYYEEGEVFVRRQAAIQQKSGVNWDDVLINLISGKPAISIAPQLVEDWVLMEQSNSSKAYRTIACPEISYSDYDGDIAIEEITDNFAGDSRYSFNIDGTQSINGEGKTIRVEVDSFMLDGEIEYLAAPAINNSAYAIVHCGNWAEHKLMPGKAQVFSNNSYLGSFNMSVPLVGDTLELSLGADPHVMCSRELSAEESTSRKFGGRKEVNQTWKLLVENTHSDSVSVNLVDRIPRTQSRDSKVEISVIVSEGGQADMQAHEVLFKMELGPNERRVVTYDLIITYPSSMSLKNL